MTGGRLKRIKEYVDDKTFCFTYGDGVADVQIDKLIKFHNDNKTIATVTAVQPPGRFGTLDVKQDKIISFKEKPPGDGNWINGGYFVLEPSVFDYLKDDSTVWEREPLEKLAKDKQLSAYKHSGFWQPLDTLRDKNKLEDLWSKGNAPWKIWE
jgi:glucose-1-phosphate cytidylyltransferase